MTNSKAVPMVELWRGGRLESAHAGHAVICDERGRSSRPGAIPKR